MPGGGLTDRIARHGADQVGIEAVVDALDTMLKDGAPAPSAWPELSMFAPARAYPSRHRCVLLPFLALLAALRNPAGPPENLGAGDTAIPPA